MTPFLQNRRLGADSFRLAGRGDRARRRAAAAADRAPVGERPLRHRLRRARRDARRAGDDDAPGLDGDARRCDGRRRRRVAIRRRDRTSRRRDPVPPIAASGRMSERRDGLGAAVRRTGVAARSPCSARRNSIGSCPPITIAWLVGVALLLGRMAGGWWQRATAASRRARHPFVALADGLPPPRVSPRPAGRGARGRIGAGRRADRRRLAAAGDSASGRGDRVADAGAGRSDSRARARAHPAARLRGERAADDRRDAAVLSPRCVVGVEPHSRRARALLRRRRGRASAAIRSATRRRSPSSRPGARASARMAMAATGGSLLDRVRRILRVPMTDEPRSPSWAIDACADDDFHGRRRQRAAPAVGLIARGDARAARRPTLAADHAPILRSAPRIGCVRTNKTVRAPEASTRARAATCVPVTPSTRRDARAIAGALTRARTPLRTLDFLSDPLAPARRRVPEPVPPIASSASAASIRRCRPRRHGSTAAGSHSLSRRRPAPPAPPLHRRHRHRPRRRCHAGVRPLTAGTARASRASGSACTAGAARADGFSASSQSSSRRGGCSSATTARGSTSRCAARSPSPTISTDVQSLSDGGSFTMRDWSRDRAADGRDQIIGRQTDAHLLRRRHQPAVGRRGAASSWRRSCRCWCAARASAPKRA